MTGNKWNKPQRVVNWVHIVTHGIHEETVRAMLQKCVYKTIPVMQLGKVILVIQICSKINFGQKISQWSHKTDWLDELSHYFVDRNSLNILTLLNSIQHMLYISFLSHASETECRSFSIDEKCPWIWSSTHERDSIVCCF